MKVVILAAGRSNRMKPVGDKNFLKFLGKPLILWQLEMVKNAGFAEVVIVGHEGNVGALRDCVGAEATVVEEAAIGMSGAVLGAKEAVGDEGMLIFSSNDVVDESAFAAVKAAAEAGDAHSFILGKKVEKYFPGGYLEMDAEGMISHIVEKPGEGNEPSDMVNLVVHLHKDSGKVFEYLEKAESDSDDVYEVALAAMMKAGVKMQAVEYDDFWQPIKFPWHVQKVFKYLFKKSAKAVAESAQIAESAIVKGEVIIGENVKVMEGAVISGPCYIGDNCVVANNALVRDSHVGSDSVVGFSTEVARSFLGEEVWTHSNYIGDSVIGNNVSFGAGTVTGNLRLDEVEIAGSGETKLGLICGNEVRAGINVSFMPGVRVGSGSFISAGIVVGQDVEPRSFVRGSWELKISENKSTVGERSDLKKKL